MAGPAGLDRVIAAFKKKEYRTAARLLNPLLQSHGNDPWVQVYAARLHELSGKRAIAEPIYRKLLQNTTAPNPKILNLARQGLERLEKADRDRRKVALDEARQQSAGTQGSQRNNALFVLEPLLEGGDRKAAAQILGKVFDLDPYSARLQIPSREWRVYRMGPLAELKIYEQELTEAGLPCFAAPVAGINAIKVFQVRYLEAVEPQVTVVCENGSGQLGRIQFNWGEVTSRAMGDLPLFGSVVDLDARGQLMRREQMQDFAHVMDVHLGDRQTLLRLVDSQYQFDQGVDFVPVAFLQEKNRQQVRPTRRTQWNAVTAFFDQQLPGKSARNQLEPFSSTVSDRDDLLLGIKPHLRLSRSQDHPMDSIFHLYSALIAWHGNQNR